MTSINSKWPGFQSAQWNDEKTQVTGHLWFNSHNDGFKMSFSSDDQPRNTLSNPMPCTLSKGQFARLRQLNLDGIPYEVKRVGDFNVRIFEF